MDIERITFITRASHRYRNNQFHHTWIQKKSLSSHRQRKNHFHRTWIQKESLSSHMDLERITFITWIKKGSLSSHMDLERITFIKQKIQTKVLQHPSTDNTREFLQSAQTLKNGNNPNLRIPEPRLLYTFVDRFSI